jgi:V/A-type H+-transporting ATPase subunit E
MSKGRPAALTLSEQSRAIKGGLILSDGNIEINCSIETITALRKNELAGEVAKLLFS